VYARSLEQLQAMMFVKPELHINMIGWKNEWMFVVSPWQSIRLPLGEANIGCKLICFVKLLFRWVSSPPLWDLLMLTSLIELRLTKMKQVHISYKNLTFLFSSKNLTENTQRYYEIYSVLLANMCDCKIDV
jgi:hypothetical protein